jgi:WD40 repeat protein
MARIALNVRLFSFFGVLTSVMILFFVHVTFAQEPLTNLPYVELVNTGRVSDVSWGPDGTMVALAVDNSIWLYYSDTLENIGHLDGHTDEVLTLDWSPDGLYLASGGMDDTIRIWDMHSGDNFGTLFTTLEGHTDWVLKLQWSPDGSRIASITPDRSIPPVNGTELSLATWIWNVSTEQVERVLPVFVGSIALDWQPNSQIIANAGSGTDYGPAVRIWDADTGQLQFAMPVGGEKQVSNIVWNPDGTFLAVGSEWPDVFIADVNTQNFSLDLQGLGPSSTVTWKPDGTQLAAGDQYGNLGIWDVGTTQLLVNIANAHSGVIRKAEWSPAGDKLATISSVDNLLRIWDTIG